MDGGDQIRQFDRLHFLFGDQAFLGAVTLVLRKNGRIEEPRGEGRLLGQVIFGRFAAASSLSGSRDRLARSDQAQLRPSRWSSLRLLTQERKL